MMERWPKEKTGERRWEGERRVRGKRPGRSVCVLEGAGREGNLARNCSPHAVKEAPSVSGPPEPNLGSSPGRQV